MIIFLYGPDTYSSRQKLNAIIDRYKSIHKSGLALTRATRENFDFEKFKQVLKTVSMFNEKKLIILEDLLGATRSQISTELLKSDFNKLKTDKDTIIVFWEQSPDKRSSPFKWLKANAQCQEFKLADARELRGWVEDKIKNQKAKIKNEAIERLVLYIGSDLWRMSNEVEKLITFRRGKVITAGDVDLLVNSQVDLNIFKTIDALARGAKPRALELIWGYLDRGTDPSYLFSMILWQFRNLIKVSSYHSTGYNQIARVTGLHPFVIKKSTFLARRFTEDSLKSIYGYLLDIDLAIKTGRIDPRIALDLLAMEM